MTFSNTQETKREAGGCDDVWEQAYLRFETPAEETAKFLRRMKQLGAGNWPRQLRIVELFCGRGGGLIALEQMGFNSLEGVDISAALLSKYSGIARTYEADCRKLPFEQESKDVVIAQGGLHHLQSLPDDLSKTLNEARRVLVKDGRFVAVEPWMTTFLALVHAIVRTRPARLLSKLDALATMIEHERNSYENWLGRPDEILKLLNDHFEPELCAIRWGKLMYVGRKK
jgi:ubiquinone/menaquinone biosynthesis C-methylase UbiE